MIGEKKLILAHSFRERSIYLDLQRDLLRAYLQLGRRRGLDRDSLAHLGRAPRRRPPTRARTSASSFTLAYSEIFLELRFLKPLLAGSLLVYGYPTFELLLGERRRLLLVYGRSFERSTAHTGPRPNFHFEIQASTQLPSVEIPLVCVVAIFAWLFKVSTSATPSGSSKRLCTSASASGLALNLSTDPAT